MHASFPRLATIQTVRRIVLVLLAYGAALGIWQLLRQQLVTPDPRMSERQREMFGSMASDPEFWGRSLASGQPVSDVLIEGAGASLTLVAGAVALGLFFGLLAALTGAGLDRWTQRQPLLGGASKAVARLLSWPWIALPLYVLALVLVQRFAIASPLFPAIALRSDGSQPISAMVLPLLTLAGVPATFVAAATYDAWRRGAWWSGAGAALAALGRALLALSGALVLVEIVFNWPGVGRLITQALFQRDAPVIAAAVQALLTLGLIGTLLAVLGDGWARAAAPDPATQPVSSSTSGRGDRVWLFVTLALLLVPLGLLLFSLGADSDTALRIDPRQRNLPPSADHPFGTDELGRDLQTRLLLGVRGTWAIAALASAVAVVGGGVWGGVAAAVARWRGALGESIADALLLPAWIGTLLAGLILAVVLRAATIDSTAAASWTLPLLLGAVLLPRVALAWRDIQPNGAWSGALIGRAVLGLGLWCFGVALLLSIGLDVVGLGVQPPNASLGNSLQQINAGTMVQASYQLYTALWLISALSVPCFFAGWALLRPLQRTQALATLEA